MPELIVSGGKVLGERRIYSDTLLATLLAAGDPERYGREAAIALHVNAKGPAAFTFGFEGDGLGPLGRNGTDVIEGEAENERALPPAE